MPSGVQRKARLKFRVGLRDGDAMHAGDTDVALLLVFHSLDDLLQGESHVHGTHRYSQNIDGIGVTHDCRAVIGSKYGENLAL